MVNLVYKSRTGHAVCACVCTGTYESPCTLALATQTYQQLVVHSLDDYLLRLVLADVKSQLQKLAVAFVLDERRVESIQPSLHLALLGTPVGCRRGGSAVSDGGAMPC